MFCVALTGTIACGKSTVAKLFANYCIDVIESDIIARQLTAKDTECYRQIIDYFGVEILQSDTLQIDRGKLKTIIFAQPRKRLWLETLLHPEIRKQIEQQVYTSHTPYCIVEIPLLYHLKPYPYINRVLLITAPETIQIARIIQRDNISEDQARRILDAQPDEANRKAIADDVIENNSNFESLKSKVEILHRHYLQLSETG